MVMLQSYFDIWLLACRPRTLNGIQDSRPRVHCPSSRQEVLSALYHSSCTEDMLVRTELKVKMSRIKW